MGRMKEAPGYGAGDGRGFFDVSPRRRCPVCDGRSWCQVARDGGTVLCKRVESPIARENRDGVTYYVHHEGGAWERPPMEHREPSRARASVEALDAAHRAILAALTLDGSHRAALERRGLDAATIRANGYRSLPVRGRAALAAAVIEAVGEEVARGVPGLSWQTKDGRGWWSLGGAPGLVVPARDEAGRVVALKVRRDDPGDGPRYLYVSSARHGGASAASVVHVPLEARSRWEGGARELVVTEGELKADVSTALLGRPVVSLPGVGAWALAVELADAWRPSRVAVAFDMDATRNVVVARARRCLLEALRARGHPVAAWAWDDRFKGLDDYLARGRTEVNHAA